jgi:hypothetical protein
VPDARANRSCLHGSALELCPTRAVSSLVPREVSRPRETARP